jgi:hypothetical protein
MRRPLLAALATAAIAAIVLGLAGRRPASNATAPGPAATAGAPEASAPAPGGDEGAGDASTGNASATAAAEAPPPDDAAAAELDSPSPWLGPGNGGTAPHPPEAKAPGPPTLAPAPRPPASRSKPEAPPSLTDPLRLEASKIAGPTLKPQASGSARAAGSARPPRPSAVPLYGDAERALVAGRGRECLSLLDRADAMPAEGADLREREQRAASPVVRAQCLMLLGGCDEGAGRLRAAGWSDAAIEGARARFCGKGPG